MVKQESLHSHLESIAGPDGVRPEDEMSRFVVDGLTPLAAVAPSTYEEVGEVMRYAHTEGLAVIPWGGGTHMHIGNLPGRYDIALSLSRLQQIVEHEPADLTVTCQAGITLARLQGHLVTARQLAPLGPPSGDKATIGGILAANASGASRHAYGAPRDFTIGMRIVTPDGRVTKAGGRVVKNVAGYDLCKLYIGSLGTLGLIVEATFKLAPLPKARRTAVATFEAVACACAFAAELHHRRLAVRAVQLLNAAATSSARLPASGGLCTLVLDLAGTPQAVERSWRETGELAQDAAADLTTVDDSSTVEELLRQLASPGADALLCRVAALPTQLPALIEALEAADGPPHILALPTIGILYAAWPTIEDAESVAKRLRAIASQIGASLVLEVCPPDLKRRLDVFPDVPRPSFALMRRVKQEFDPAGILSPGRFVGRL